MSTVTTNGTHTLPDPADFAIEFPNASNGIEQDEEEFRFEYEDETRSLRIHDYDEMYKVPGLYEALVYRKLRCQSPPTLARLLTSVLRDWPTDPAELRVLDVGAGNGIMVEELRRHGVRHAVGLDLLEEARMAARRDRPGVYNDYLVTDLCNLSEDEKQRLSAHRFNCLVTVAALGFGDIPPAAFASAFRFIATGGWIGMTIKEDFLDQEDETGFGSFLQAMINEGVLDVQAHQRYCHRRSINGEQLFYVAIIARKASAIPNHLNHGAVALDAVGPPHVDLIGQTPTMLLGR